MLLSGISTVTTVVYVLAHLFVLLYMHIYFLQKKMESLLLFYGLLCSQICMS